MKVGDQRMYQLEAPNKKKYFDEKKERTMLRID